MSISVVMNTKNMAETLPAAIKSVAKLADEVVVVDMNSTDGTVELAKKLGATVFEYKQNLGFADPARNFALSKAKSDWTFVLDADEEVSEGLAKLLRQVVKQEVPADLQGDCYYVPRQNIIFGQALAHTGWWPDYQLRFFKRGTVHWTDKVHTQPEFEGQLVYLPAETGSVILHHNYQTVQQFIDRLNRYTNLELAKKSSKESKKQCTPEELVKSFSAEFFKRMFVSNGLADGMHGLSLSFLQSFYELTVFLKQWQELSFPESENYSSVAHQQKSVRALHHFQKDLSYWLADWHVQHSHGLVQVYWKLRRKLATR